MKYLIERDESGTIVGLYANLQPDLTGEALPEDHPEVVAFLNPVAIFKPIEPAPFWLAAKDLLGIKKSDVLDAITDPDERYEAELSVMDRKRYLRDDPMVTKLSELLGYPPAQMDSLWLYVQENYV